MELAVGLAGITMSDNNEKKLSLANKGNKGDIQTTDDVHTDIQSDEQASVQANTRDGNSTEYSYKKLKVFISYSWKSSDNVNWVNNLVDKLTKDDIDVVIDRKDVQLGDDIYKYMERAVNDSSIQKVLVICDKSYKEDADSRSPSGVGTEARLIASDVNKNQRKYIPIVNKVDVSGKPYIPTFLNGLLYADLSKDFDHQYQQLLLSLMGVTSQVDNNNNCGSANSNTTAVNTVNTVKPDISAIQYKGYFNIDTEVSTLTRGDGWSRLKLAFQNVTSNVVTSFNLYGTNQIASSLSSCTWPRDKADSKGGGVVVTQYTSYSPSDISNGQLVCTVHFSNYGQTFCILCLKGSNKTIYGIETVQLFTIVMIGDKIVKVEVETIA